MMCHYEVPGYSLAWKRWGLFRVDHVHPVDYNDQAFGNLVFPEHKKKLIRLLVEQRDIENGSFDDLIKGKGRSVIFLLHGPPGVGKTYTAGNRFADPFAIEKILTIIPRQRALQITPAVPSLPLARGKSSGQLRWWKTGFPSCSVWPRSGTLSSWWTRRTYSCKNEPSRIWIETPWYQVSLKVLSNSQPGTPPSLLTGPSDPTAFLRILEYFEGTMFLTTNRAETLDSAFHSRIHLSISYPSLPPTALSELWISGITRACGGRRPRWIAGALLRTLSSSGINGREVKNIISMAYGLASREKRAIKPADILYGLEALKSFEAEFKTNR